MEELPQEMLCHIFSFVPLVGLINMRLVNKNLKNFVEENLKFFYFNRRIRNSKLPRLMFCQDFVTNIKKYKIGSDWVKRNAVLDYLKKTNDEEKLEYLISNGIKIDLSRTLVDADNRIIERYLFLKNKGENNYSCQIHAFSDWDDMDIYKYLFLKRKGETPYTAEKLIDLTDNQLKKYLFLSNKEGNSFQAEYLARNFSDEQFHIYFYLRDRDIYPFSAKSVAQKFDDDKIVKFLYLVERGISTYRAELIVDKIDDKTLARFIACMDVGLSNTEAEDIIKNLTTEETRKFLNLKSEGINELNSLLIADFDL